MDSLADTSITARTITRDVDAAPPTRVRTVVVGGGIVGLSTAYHLAAAGEEVVVLEANKVSSGTSWHAAGLVTASRSTPPLTELAKYGRDLFATLQERTGVDVAFGQHGSLSLARRQGRVDENLYTHDVARQLDVVVEIVDAAEVRRLWPLADTAGVLSALYLPDDGYLSPGWATLAFAKLAHESDARIHEGVRVEHVLTAGGRVTGVRTATGDVECERVVLACGLWTRDLARTAGIHVPLHAAEHVHVRSHEIAGAVPELAVIRDLDNSFYIRPEAGRLLVGAFEPEGVPRSVDEIGERGFATFDPDWGRFAPVRGKAETMVPSLQSAGYDRFINAPESFTPDTNFLLGEAAEVENLYISAGYNSQGIIYAGGAGRALAEWIMAGAPQFDSSAVDVRRFSRHQSNRRYLRARTHESLGKLYAMHWPGLQPVTARNVRRSPLHERLTAHGAYLAELNAWERAAWFGDPGTRPTVDYSYGKQNWFDRVGEEHRATREAVTLFDLSSFAKMEVAGPDALAVVQEAFTAQLDTEIGRAVYTLALNRGGGIELDGTVTRLAEDRFLVVTPAYTQDWTLGRLRRTARDRAAVATDITSGLATIGVFGPNSRTLVERISPEDWGTDTQPYLRGREVEIADGWAYALRVSFVGELGYELYAPTETAVNLFDALFEAGQDLGVRLAGYYALDTLRIEKGFRHLGHDIGPVDDPYTAGLGFTVALDKGFDFVGREAAAAAKAAERTRRAVYLHLTDPDRLLHHDERVFADGRPVGRVASSAYGYTIGGATAIAYIDASVDVAAAAFEVESQGELYRAIASRSPFYDPKGLRLKA